MKRAMLFERLPGRKVKCDLCAHRCVIFPGRAGICRVRENIEGELYMHAYCRIISYEVDPVEKKPLNHFHPGSITYSIHRNLGWRALGDTIPSYLSPALRAGPGVAVDHRLH